MKAAVFKAPRRLEIETLPDPLPGPGEVVIRVGRCGICGSDIHMTETHELLPPGSVLGHEFSGEIAALGAGVDGLRIGDRVAALPMSGCGECATCRSGNLRWCARFKWTAGGFAQYVTTSAFTTLKLPDILTLADGALVEPLAVSAHAMRLAGNLAGASVLVVGAGPIGLAAAYWAKRFGAGTIAIIAASRRRQVLAQACGIENFIVNDADADRSVTALFGGLPEVVVECVGLPGTFARSLELVRPRGTLIVAGACVGTDHFTPIVAMLKELRVLFSIMYEIDDFRVAIDALDSGALEVRAMLTDTVGMDTFTQAFESLRAPNAHCKVMLSPWT